MMTKKTLSEIWGRFLRAKFSPATSFLFDELVDGGETFIGEEQFGKDLSAADVAWQRLAPLFMQDLVEAMREMGMIHGAAVAAPGFFGYGVTTYDTQREIINERLRQDIHVTDEEGNRILEMRDLSPAQLRQITQDKQIRQDIHDIRNKGREDYMLASGELRDLQQVNDDLRLVKGEVNGNDWRDDRSIRAIKSANVIEVREALEGKTFDSSQAPQGAVGVILRLMGAGKEVRTANEQALFDWYEIIEPFITDPTTINSIGIDPKNLTPEERDRLSDTVDFKGLGDARDKFLAGLTEAQLDYVVLNAYPGRTGVEDVFLRGQRMMKDYWEIPESLAGENVVELYEQYRDLPAEYKQNFLIQHPSVKRLSIRVKQEQQKMRVRNKEIDEFLVIFYDGIPQHRDLVRESRARRYPDRIRERVLTGADARLDERLNLKGIER